MPFFLKFISPKAINKLALGWSTDLPYEKNTKIITSLKEMKSNGSMDFLGGMLLFFTWPLIIIYHLLTEQLSSNPATAGFI